jgi:hypothetical protein
LCRIRWRVATSNRPRATHSDVHRMRAPAADRCPRKPTMAATVRPVFASTPSRATATARSHTSIAFEDQIGSTPFNAAFANWLALCPGTNRRHTRVRKLVAGSSRAGHSPPDSGALLLHFHRLPQLHARTSGRPPGGAPKDQMHERILYHELTTCIPYDQTAVAANDECKTSRGELGQWIRMLAQSDAGTGPKISALLPQ